jgi:hypothetical protein
MSETPGKDFFNFFYNFFAGCRSSRHPAKSFFYFFSIFFAECPVRTAPGKEFFLKKIKKSLPGALALALGNTER